MQEEVIIVIASVIIILLFLGVMFLLALIYFNNKKRRMAQEKKRLETVFTEELLRTRLEIQEEIFRNISQEIHDNIGQNMSLLNLTLAMVNPSTSAQLKQTIDSCKLLVSKTSKDLRNLAHSLNPDFIETIGLPAAIEQQLEQLQKTTAFTTSFTVTGQPVKLGHQKELILLRVVQELLNNSIKHAQATSVTITMEYTMAGLALSIADNGRGFEMVSNKQMDRSNGMGLLTVQNRVNMIGGNVAITTSPGKGVNVFIHI